mgnify:CR=1 FL=1
MLITGHIKFGDTFLRGIKDFVDLKNEGVDEIILSTWKGELDKKAKN